jgi:hypothetical protein
MGAALSSAQAAQQKRAQKMGAWGQKAFGLSMVGSMIPAMFSQQNAFSDIAGNMMQGTAMGAMLMPGMPLVGMGVGATLGAGMGAYQAHQRSRLRAENPLIGKAHSDSKY